MKHDVRLIKIKKFLVDNQKATFTDLLKGTNILQPKELSSDLKELLRKKIISAEQGKKDRRKTWYMIIDKNRALADLKRYEFIKFLQNMNEPLFAETQIEEDGDRRLISFFIEDPFTPVLKRYYKDQEAIKLLRSILDDLVKGIAERVITKESGFPYTGPKSLMIYAYESSPEKNKEFISALEKSIKEKKVGGKNQNK